MDIVVDFDVENLIKFKSAIESVSFKMFSPVEILKLSEDSYRHNLKNEKNAIVLSLVSDLYKDTTIDILLSFSFDFENTYKKRLEIETGEGFPIDIIDLKTLIAMKEETKRPQDIKDIHFLKKIYEDI